MDLIIRDQARPEKMLIKRRDDVDDNIKGIPEVSSIDDKIVKIHLGCHEI